MPRLTLFARSACPPETCGCEKPDCPRQLIATGWAALHSSRVIQYSWYRSYFVTLCARVKCTECDRLRIERENKKSLYELAIRNLHAAAPRTPLEQYTRLKKLADEAKRDLDLVNAEITQHQSRTKHAV